MPMPWRKRASQINIVSFRPRRNLSVHQRAASASVRVAEVELAPEVDDIGRPWHARLSAAGKLYRIISVSIDCWTRLRAGSACVPRPLNYEAMRRALPYLNGLVDRAALANRRAGESSPSLRRHQ